MTQVIACVMSNIMYTLCAKLSLHVYYIIHLAYSVLFVIHCAVRIALVYIRSHCLYIILSGTFWCFSLFTRLRISNYGKSLHIYVYNLLSKNRIGNVKKSKKNLYFE